MYFHKAQEKPRRWGSFQDIQYSIKRNMESIYLCDPDNEVLAMPLFWGLPCLDFSGNNNHGTNHGATYKDGSLDFDGTDDYVTSGLDTDTLDAATTFSIWANISDYKNTLVSGYAGLPINRWSAYILSAVDDKKVKWVEYDDTGVGALSSTADVSLDTRAYIVIIHDIGNTDLHFYINGDFDSTHVISLPLTTEEFVSIGARPDGTSAGSSTYHCNGIIDEVCISNTVRTAETIGIFYERPWDLYRRVSRPVYFLPSAAAWTGKFTGISNPAKINGVAVANISKVMGIS